MKSAAQTPEEALLRLGTVVRSNPGTIVLPALADWTREVEAQLKDLRERLDATARTARRTAYEADPLNRIG